MSPAGRTVAFATACFAAAGCSGVQSALEPHGPAAAAIAQSTWIMAAGALAILALVTGLALYAVYRAPERRRSPSSAAIIVGGGIVLPVIALTALLVYGVTLSERIHRIEGDALQLEVVAHRWWWEIRYPGAQPGERVATANELRLPAGRAVTIALSSADVIHSFWVPSLAGKMDAIPGRVNRITLRADRPGRFRGQCAEFCGAQHARMALQVVAEAPEDFERWLEQLRSPAARTSAPGERLFEQHCARCHAVRGVTPDRADAVAPDLTHIASRPSLGAGAVENTRSNVARWIARNEEIKPGNLMPEFRELEAAELSALADWLATLR